jgi:oligoendopeptidase F
MSKIIEFLQSIGTPAEVITALEASDDSTDLSGLVEQTETHFNNFYVEKVKDDIHKKGKGAGFSEAITYAKKVFGLTEAEIKEIKGDITKVYELAQSKLSEKVGNKEAIEQINQYKQQLIDFENKVKQYEEEVIPAVKNEADNRINQFKVNSAIQSELVKHPLIGASQYVVPGFTQDFTKKYKVSVDDNGQTIVTDLNGAKVFGKDKKELNLNELIVMEGKEAKIFKESNASEPPAPKAGTPAPSPSGTPKTARDKYYQDAQAKIDAQKAKAGLA